jgi:signal transduction histidine kinase
LTLAERSILPDVAFDVQQATRHLDHAAWSAIRVAEAEITARAYSRLARGSHGVAPVMPEAMVNLIVRALEGALHYGQASFGARDAARSMVQRADADAAESEPDITDVYDAVLDAIHQAAPAAEEAARSAAHSILHEAAILAAQYDDRSPLVAADPPPIPPLAFRGLADLPHVAYVVDRALRFAYVNRAWETFAAQNNGQACLPSTVIGESWIAAISGPDRQHWRSIAEQVLAGAIPSYREEIPCHSPSACRFLVVTVSPLRLAEDDAEVAGLVFVTYDVTDLRRAEIERLWMDQEGRRLRDVFVGTVAHDLRNPLTAIKGRTQLLRLRAARADTPLPASFQDGLEAIEATAEQMTGQIDELLDVAQVQAGHPTHLRSRPTDLTALLRTTMQAHEHLLAGHRLVLVAPEAPLVGHWDDVRVRRVIANLISNGIKYSTDGGEIVVTAWREDGEGQRWAVFSVRDQGIGIPAGDLPSIFSSFFRGSNVDAEIGGFGLGLAGAHQIITQHGGQIDVASELGVGTTFTVRLPLDEETEVRSQESGAPGRTASEPVDE